jgi:hypothetical protein
VKNVAFVTYNTVGNGLSSGWHGSNGRRALLVQNGDCQEYAVDKFYDADPDGYSRADHADHIRDEIGRIWDNLLSSITELDHIVIYVGSSGSERAIELAAKLPAEKITFVGCDCDLLLKELMIRAAGLTSAGRVLCECGGRRTMGALYERFMGTGELLPVRA